MKKRIFFLALLLTFCLGTAASAAKLDPPLWMRLDYTSEQEFCVDTSYLSPDGSPLSHADYDLLESIFVESRALQEISFSTESSYDTPEHLIAYYGVDDFDALLDLLAWQQTQTQFEREAEKRKARAALGLTSPGISLMVNGAPVAYPADTRPEERDGSTYVPVRATAEALGGTVAFANDTITITRGDTALHFPTASAEMQVTNGQETHSVPLPAPVYTKNGAAYIPARAFAEALGYDVLWDNELECVVALDQDALVREIDASFSIINRVFDAQKPLGDAYQLSISAKGEFTVFNTLDGDQTYPASVALTVIHQGNNYQLNTQLQLDGLCDWLKARLFGETPADPSSAELSAIETLRDVNLELILNYDTDTVYLRSPELVELLTLLSDAELPANMAKLSKNAWYKLENAGLTDMDFGSAMPGMGDSVGATLYAAQLHARDNPAAFCKALQAQAQALQALFGDAQFKKQGKNDVLAIDSASASAAALQDELAAMGVASFSLDLIVAPDGALTGECNIRQGNNWGRDAQLTAKLEIKDGHTAIDLTYHHQNTSETRLILLMQVDEATDAAFTPPEHLLVLDLEAILAQSNTP